VVVEPDTGLTTAAALTKATGPENSDASMGAALLDTDTTVPDGDGDQVEVLGDSAYGTGEMLDALDKKGHAATIKPWPLRSAVEGGFTLDDFAYDDQTGTVTCPNGVTRPLTRTRQVIFGRVCQGCPLRDRCTTAAGGRKMRLHPHERLQRQHRERAQDPQFQQTYREKRPMVERSIAWLVRGNRRVPYRGVAKNHAWLQHRVAALNLRRLLALGLTFDERGWQIA